MSARGFSLIELLIACALVVIIGGAVAALVAPLGAALERTETVGQMEPAGRTVLEAVLADVREAGSDPGIAAPDVGFARVVERVSSLRSLGSDELAWPGGALRVIRVPHLGAQGLLRAAVAEGDVTLPLDTAARCAGGPPACRFLPGALALLYNGAGAERVVVDAIGEGFVRLRSPLASGFAAGAVLAELVSHTYGTRSTPDGSRQLVRLTTGALNSPSSTTCPSSKSCRMRSIRFGCGTSPFDCGSKPRLPICAGQLAICFVAPALQATRDAGFPTSSCARRLRCETR